MSKGEEDAIADPLIRECIQYCWSRNFLDIFRAYFRKHAAPFKGYPPKRDMEQAEHQLEHWELFQDYLKLYENTLSEWLDEKGASLREFYEKVQDVKERSTDPKEQEFIHCLLASCDYDSFYSVMVREADRQSAMERLQVSAPAESKSEGKGGDDDDDEELDVKGSGAKDAK
jgi:hypothetical protein